MKYFIRVILISIIASTLFSADENSKEKSDSQKSIVDLRAEELLLKEKLNNQNSKEKSIIDLRAEELLLKEEANNSEQRNKFFDLESLRSEMKEKEFRNNHPQGSTRECNEAWYGDGWCDASNNEEECTWDGGDCCPGDCVDGTYQCEFYGGTCEDCLNPDSADNASGGECYEAGPCGEEFLCWDGSCAPTEEECPETCEEQGGTVCWDGSCAIDVDCPDEPECDDGYVADCDGSGDCCSAAWIGDGLCDGTLQGWGCDLTCYECDGGDCLGQTGDDVGCVYCEDEGLITCWDYSCVTSEDDCPEVTCADTDCSYYLSFGYTCQEIESTWGYDCSVCQEEEACPWVCEDDGLVTCWDNSCAEVEDDCPYMPDCAYLQYYADGYCDGGNNTESCDYDGGDCCPGECADTVENGCPENPDGCWGTTPGAYCGDCVDCIDENSPDNGEGGECEDYVITCADTPCGSYLSGGYYTCQELEGFGYDCSLCQAEGACPYVCEDDGLFTCWDDSCVEDLADCPEASCAEAGGIESWIADGYCDSSNNMENCDWDGGDCCGSTCLVSTYDCVGSGEGSYGACYNECLDPEANDDCCVDNSCPFTCEGNGLITCLGYCVETIEECPYPDCDSSYPQYLGDGICSYYTYGLNTEGCGYDGGDCCYSTNANNDALCGGACDCQDPESCEGQNSCTEGCTNPDANNYDSDALYDDGSCEYPEGSYLVTCDGGSWQAEVSWDLINNQTNEVELSGGAPFESTVVLGPGTYYLEALDSYGDGWNGNVWIISGNELYFEYTIDTGSEGTSENFVIEETGCPYLGDVNGDGDLNVVDIVAIVNGILGQGDLEAIMFCGDFNQDGNLNVVDVVGIVNAILGD